MPAAVSSLKVLILIVLIIRISSIEIINDFLNQRLNAMHAQLDLLHLRPEHGCMSKPHHRYWCPTPEQSNITHGWKCIYHDELCNGIPDCPNGEDEEPTYCMFYIALEHKIHSLRKAIIDQYERDHYRRKRSATEV